MSEKLSHTITVGAVEIPSVIWHTLKAAGLHDEEIVARLEKTIHQGLWEIYDDVRSGDTSGTCEYE